jgi:hypothetical protein
VLRRMGVRWARSGRIAKPRRRSSVHDMLSHPRTGNRVTLKTQNNKKLAS